MEKFLEKKNQWAILLLVGILLVVIAIPSGESDEKSREQASVQAAAEPETTVEDEVGRLEKRLEEVLSEVQGVGRTKVMITMESTGEKIVEKDNQTSSRSTSEDNGEGNASSSADADASESTVFEKKQDGSESPYVTRETALKIRGVLVVAEGGDNPVTVQNITGAVMALFGVEAHKIKVMKMN